MADVKPPRVRGTDPEPDEDRAQMILITGLTLAVILVAVVLLLNTVIYTENLATRGVDAGGAEAVDFRDGTVEDVAAIMEREHRTESGSDGVGDDFNATMSVYSDVTGDLRLRDGVIADVSAVTNETGHFIAQDELADGGYRAMTNESGTSDWTLATTVTRTRNYQLTVNERSLDEEPFTVVANRSGATWSMSVSGNASGDGIEVTVDNGTGTPESESFDGSEDGSYTIDVTGGTVAGNEWKELVWAENVQNGAESYEIRYENGDAAAGTYHFVVDEMDDPSADPNEPYGTTPADRTAQPYVVDAVYSADVEVHHRTPELEYRDVVRVAPGENDA